MAVLGAYAARLTSATISQALDVLGRAHRPIADWRIPVSAGRGARPDGPPRGCAALRDALKDRAGRALGAVNLGLSYALSKQLPRAEATLKRAAAGQRVDPRVRQNLALVVGLQGRFAEAESIARADLPAEEASANVAYLRDMLARQSDAQIQEPPRRTADARKG